MKCIMQKIDHIKINIPILMNLLIGFHHDFWVATNQIRTTDQGQECVEHFKHSKLQYKHKPKVLIQSN